MRLFEHKTDTLAWSHSVFLLDECQRVNCTFCPLMEKHLIPLPIIVHYWHSQMFKDEFVMNKIIFRQINEIWSIPLAPLIIGCYSLRQRTMDDKELFKQCPLVLLEHIVGWTGLWEHSKVKAMSTRWAKPEKSTNQSPLQMYIRSAVSHR